MIRPGSAIPARRSGGFTLVELLLAMTLLSILMALAYGGLRASTRAAERGQIILEDSGRIRMGHQFVRRQLSQMMPLVFEQEEDGTERKVFIGNSSMIRFVAPMPGYLGYGGPQVQELAFVPGEEGMNLVFTHALLQNFEEAHLDERPPIVLLENIQSGEFAFLGLDEFGQLTPWLNQWDEPEYLPESVSVSVEFSEEIYLEWPMMTASVRVDSEAFTGARDAVSMDKRFRARVGAVPESGGKKQ
ncbi:MAG: prepilin-type N-terminal cleavage/methylation domain-containing protein [Xanthomonadales bacterium]|nr:prepilin-type N-terminal cleavage/methylation domain-containing protein [Gammaproteobacteria bacterium]NNK37266.1 prepilin-type N-terminal cleavage/methylation domain-containing protein [Xanthomonadales bacterium]